jgi:hypothetical protein
MATKKGQQRARVEQGRKRRMPTNGRATNGDAREALLHGAVRAFAEAGWVPGDTATNDGIKCWWYRVGSDYVIAVRRITGSKACDEVGNPDTTHRFSPADVLRIRAGRPQADAIGHRA